MQFLTGALRVNTLFWCLCSIILAPCLVRRCLLLSLLLHMPSYSCSIASSNWSHLKQNIQRYFSTISNNWYIRIITQLLKSGIYLFLKQQKISDNIDLIEV